MPPDPTAAAVAAAGMSPLMAGVVAISSFVGAFVAHSLTVRPLVARIKTLRAWVAAIARKTEVPQPITEEDE